MGELSQYFDSVRNIVKETFEDGSVAYTYNGTLHRHDGPAVIDADGTKMWYRHGERHREDGPAQEFADGSRHWYQNNVLHRDRGAAIEEPNGTRHWYHHGNLIALDDEAGHKFLNRQRAQRYVDADLAKIANGEMPGRERSLSLGLGLSR